MGSSEADQPSVYEQPEVHQAAEFELLAQQFQHQQVGVEVTNDGGNNASNYDQNQQPQPPNKPQNDPQGQGGQQQVLFHHHQQQQPPQTQPIRYTMPPQGTQPNLYQAQQPRPLQFHPPQSPQTPINPNGLNQPQPQFQAQNYPPQSPQFQAQGQQYPPQSPQFQAQQTYQPAQMNQPRPVQLSPQIQKMQSNPMYANGPNNQPAMGAQPSPAKFSSPQHQNGIGGGGGMPPNYIHGNQAAHQQQNYPAEGVPVQIHNSEQARPNDMTNKQIGNGGWNSGLFDCMDDPMNALITAFVPCLTFGQIAEIVDNGTTSCATSGFLYGLIGGLIGVPCIMSCTYRTKLRSRYGLLESPAPDWVTHFLCEWCALCQEYRELQHRGLDPSIGWLGNVERNQQQANVMVPPMNQNMMA